VPRASHFGAACGRIISSGDHFFLGGYRSNGVRSAGFESSARTHTREPVVSGNYSDKLFVEWTLTNKTPRRISAASIFSSLSISGNIFFPGEGRPPWVQLIGDQTPWGGHVITGLRSTTTVFPPQSMGL